MLHSLYQVGERWGADLWAERITHRYERDQEQWSSQMRRSDGEPNNRQVRSPYGLRRLAPGTLWVPRPRTRSRRASRIG
jgi:hypothetical protein